ncbi:cleavage and polyadenylation specificity factor subunit 4-like [Lytechinus variegatus]|uniref:cleavage and polyadenylation specificity factor subunit 4-like n=1 Tax=Lytechinus variegatus TaxID=7654 RepID=UPI001BB27B5E|nr:cleavage and polyadenylation specificity factor subunit 4-like [Lytechinus variegatus]
MQTIVANVENVNFEVEVQINMQLGTLPLPFSGMDKSNSAVCQFYKNHSCVKAALCPFRHVKGDKAVVCKHWLRGLCKKGDECEFLHQFDMTKMPECFFFAKFGMCSNKDCPFLHIDPEAKRKDCPWYDRGFCKHGPLCKSRHVRRVYCPNYLLGFCPDGPNCKYVHPTFDLPTSAEMKDLHTGGRKIWTCHSCGEPGHKAINCPKKNPVQPYNTAAPPMSFSQKQAAEKQGQGLRVLSNSEVNSQSTLQNNKETNQTFQPRHGFQRGQRSYDHITCYKCGEKGHFANHCPKGHLAFLSNSLQGPQSTQQEEQQPQ